VAGSEYEAIWFDFPNLAEIKDSVEIRVTFDHEVTSAILEKWPHLKMTSLGFTGYDRVDLEHTNARRIAVYYVPGYATASVAELNLALTLSILRKIPTADRTIRSGEWDRCVKPGMELGKKTVGIVGTGTIGLATARLFQAFGCTVIGWSRSRREEFEEAGGTYVSKKAIFMDSDIIVLCLALNDNTRCVVSHAELERMREGSILINAARSELVDRMALLGALRQKRISAGIDAFESDTEKGAIDDLFQFDNVVLTPHLGFKTTEALNRLVESTIQNIGRFLAGSKENLVA
jgi:phosphoglycerate dehydrogenase-like enzyme